MKKIRNVISLLTALVMILMLSGCSPESGNTGTEEYENTVQNREPESAEILDPVSEDSTFRIEFIDVGQADAALIECDGHWMLIDGGNREDSDKIYTVLKKNEVPKLDIVVGTHAHEDHIGGLPGAFNYTTSDLTLSPVTEYDSKAFENFKKYADLNGGGITVPKVNDQYALGSAKVTILGVNSAEGANNSSIVLRIDYGNTSFLFTGDAEREAEQVILDSGADLDVDVLKVGHHGSDTSTTYPFLRETMPEYAVISCGVANSYGHPTEDTLSRLRDADVQVFRTDMQGEIYCESDGETIKFSVEKNPDAEVLSNPGSLEGAKKEPAVQKKEPEMDKQPAEETLTYVLNTNTGKFHYPDCSSVDKMKEKNKKTVTESRDTLIAQGYSPCKKCNP